MCGVPQPGLHMPRLSLSGCAHFLRCCIINSLATSTHPQPFKRPPGNILDNAELISTLEGAKSRAVEISATLVSAASTAAQIEGARVRYSPAGARGAVLYFTMTSLAGVSGMYEYSLAAFLGVFTQVGWQLGKRGGCMRCSKAAPARSAAPCNGARGRQTIQPPTPHSHSSAPPGLRHCVQALASSKPDANLSARLESIMATLTWDVYAYTTTGLFGAHKLLFSFALAARVAEGTPEALDPQVGARSLVRGGAEW